MIIYEPHNNIAGSLQKFIKDDKVKTQAILDLSKIVAVLTSEVKILIDEKNGISVKIEE